jgi:hypothetical protein
MARDFEGPLADCPGCGAKGVVVLTRDQLLLISHVFFVRGSIARLDYGAAPVIQFNELQSGSLTPDDALAADVDLLQSSLGIGFFHYGPRLWMVGEIEPLKDLQKVKKRRAVIERILCEYPTVDLAPGVEFYRVRKAPRRPEDPLEYDAPPREFAGTGRLDTRDRPVLYGSQDLQICVHESRFAAGDDLYVGTLTPARSLKLLDLTAVLAENCTEFESLDLSVLMLFLAESHSYEVARAIAGAAAECGLDGLIYPSYFSLLRTGAMPFETIYGLSLRRIPNTRDYEQSKVIGNLALFGHPIQKGDVRVNGVNRLVINHVAYGVSFGPVSY